MQHFYAVFEAHMDTERCTIGEKSSLPVFLLRNLTVSCQKIQYIYCSGTPVDHLNFTVDFEMFTLSFFDFYIKFSHTKLKFMKSNGK